MRVNYRMFFTCLAAFGLACTDSPTEPVPPLEPRRGGVPEWQVTAMTRNLYVGGDVDAIILALTTPDPTDDLTAFATVIGQIFANDLATRMAAIAAEIEATRPQAIGLQEVSKIDVEVPAGVFGPDPIVIHQDFLAELMAALEARGLRYRVAARNLNLDLVNVGGLPARLRDEDVLLLDARLPVLDASNGTYPCPLCLPVGFANITRGWVRADTRINGRLVTFVSTHFEAGSDQQIAALRAGQAQYLLFQIGPIENLVLLGDLNDQSGSPMYAVLTGDGGLTDLAQALGTAANTSNLGPNLDQAIPAGLEERIDYVMFRGQFNLDRGGAAAIRTGMTLIPGFGKYASDHLGVMGTIPLVEED